MDDPIQLLSKPFLDHGLDLAVLQPLFWGILGFIRRRDLIGDIRERFNFRGEIT